jgi:hypothetical protein
MVWLLIHTALAITAVTADPEPAGAQVIDQRPASELEVVVDGLESGRWIRLGRVDAGALYGRFECRTAGGLRLDTRGSEVDVPFARIDSLWLGRRKTGSGALIGGAIGAALGALVTWGGSELVCDATDGGCDGPPASTWALLIGGGVAAGAGIGAFVGSQTLGWQLAFP